MAVSLGQPICPNGFFTRAPFDNGGSPCAFTRGARSARNTYHVTLESDVNPNYPTVDAAPLFIELLNRLPAGTNSSAARSGRSIQRPITERLASD
jgi:hypothetical protein